MEQFTVDNLFLIKLTNCSNELCMMYRQASNKIKNQKKKLTRCFRQLSLIRILSDNTR